MVYKRLLNLSNVAAWLILVEEGGAPQGRAYITTISESPFPLTGRVPLQTENH